MHLPGADMGSGDMLRLTHSSKASRTMDEAPKSGKSPDVLYRPTALGAQSFQPSLQYVEFGRVHYEEVEVLGLAVVQIEAAQRCAAGEVELGATGKPLDQRALKATKFGGRGSQAASSSGSPMPRSHSAGRGAGQGSATRPPLAAA